MAESFGVDPAALFASVGLSAAQLSDPAARISLAQMIAVCERARVLTGEPGLGVHAGLSMRVSVYGYLGFAAMTASTLGSALELAHAFAPTVTDVIGLEFERHATFAELRIVERDDFGSVRDVVALSLLVGLWQIGQALTGHPLTGDAELALPRPSYIERFSHVLPANLRFDRPAHRLVFSSHLLDLPLVHADAVAQRLALQQCERQLATLRAQTSLVARVRGVLEAKEWPSLPEVARTLALSERTLKRKLADEGTSFSALTDALRKQRAVTLLADRTLSVEHVAERLGYSDAANFTRAFLRLSGMTPRQYRALK